jgi:uncharacterized protein YndB with AHSA1/START domain
MTTDGDLITLDGRAALRFERTYPHGIDRVWRAITEPSELSAWFPSAVVGDRSVGSQLVFDDGAQRAAAHEAGEPTRDDGPELTGRVVAFDPPAVFSFTWGSELLRFELHPEGEGTRLVFTQVLSHRSVAARNGAGWHMCLGQLGRLLDAPPSAEEEAVGFGVYQGYVHRMAEPGVPGADGSLTWEFGHHVAPERIRDAVSDPDEVAEWGGTERVDDHVHWDIRSAGTGSVVRVTVEGLAGDPERAAEWHALLVQLDMYLAAGMVVPVTADGFVDAYR